MLLAVDIGNTNIMMGLFDGEEVRRSWRISTDRERTADEYGVILLGLLDSCGLKTRDIRASAICSVVPPLEDVFEELAGRFLNAKALVVGPDVKTGIELAVDNPQEVGSDRIVNAVAAFSTHKRALIVVDFGTAVTFDYISPEGEYHGGAIAPGISMSARALWKGTARLPQVDIKRPENVVGRNTADSIRAGVFYGFVSLVDGIVERMKQEVETDPFVIATGGFAREMAGWSKTINEIDELLTLKGLRIIHELNS